jgi:glycosyltransferase involved in cell wall biosynthesis
MNGIPKVSIGVPVYNAQHYLEGCLACYLDQDFRDVEIIISDNGSTDGTRAICERIAAADPRVRYHRHEMNHGASWNYNFTLGVAKAPYFKWAAYDDLVSKDFIGACVAALDAHPEDILSFGTTVIIDAEGKETERYAEPMRIASPKPSERLREYFKKVRLTNAIYGVIRTEVLRATGGLGYFANSDVVLLAELALRGTFRELPQTHFYRRIHEKAYASNKTWSQKAVWFDPRNAGKLVLPTWQHLAAYLASLRRTPMPALEKLRCYTVFARREVYEAKDLLIELGVGLKVKLFGMRKEAF